MPVPSLRVAASHDVLQPAFDAIRDELQIEVGFAPEVHAEADEVATTGPLIAARYDLRDIPFVSIDPPGARDLDQVVAIERSSNGPGFVVHYAIADVAAFVRPGGAVDLAARQRGVTIYLPDRRAPLHPPVLSEDAASLLPGDDRQALVWRFDLDDDGVVGSTSLRRAIIRNRRAYSYEEAQRLIDAGEAEATIALLAAVGPLREELERARGGVALDVPEQIIESFDGEYRLEFRAPMHVEGWNAQISLMTGTVAADAMLTGGLGVLRTLPAPSPDELAVFRRHAHALDVEWPPQLAYGEIIRSLDPTIADHAALLAQAGRLFRGAGYAAFDEAGGVALPEDHGHAGVASPYAHVTAPLRRLVDRFGNEVVLALLNGTDPPAWVREALPDVPELMADARRREGAADGKAADVVEAAVLSGCIGDVLDAVVVRKHRKGVQIQLRHPAVVANVDADDDIGLGDEVRVRVERTDVVNRTVGLSIVP